ncbi:ABC transporter permease [Aneurinibacillus migulanus]|uniref:Lantibiotic ABC transporter permease n=1 Tax=Aneurinibacillus migulanus TaxID=47500 RepID=A0A0D1V7K5_ANEMI|nr:ABC transporter permease [Aneurinibacillus migulanus]KIV55344.1 lantibiotic ABC transporter permease [Aneurinibacillus migulanus]KON96664.1 lantibiotic ABC transporter permease [Aneurinibacillus migulanus]MED0896461.1 ABC transporter permease [Aneurinibacillus migulanus]MED1618213.1 ABC transporter permease [Aneurinibacillus migulanus]SDJ84973.1 hypothetical protein SAMN04487909_13023 [Aneurinibacillus migulanus]
MKQVFIAEAIKLQWVVIIGLILADTLLNSALGLIQMNDLRDFFEPGWLSFYIYAVNFHSMFFYPLYVGIIASLICLYEHRNGGWKQLLVLPIPRSQLYLGKFLLLISILAVTQLVFVGGFLLVGWAKNVPGTIPWTTILKSAVGGWIGILPLAALQLWLSFRIKSFGASLGIIIACLVPNIVLTGLHSWIGAWFPFTLAYYIMMPQDSPFAPEVGSISLYLIVLFTFIIYLIGGQRFFVRRDWI